MLWLRSSVDVHQTIGVETVLSSDKYRKLVLDAKRRGFEVRMIYLVLKTAALQLKRIALRVIEGGHDVPTDKAIARRHRSFRQFCWFFEQSDKCFVFDNSDGVPDLIAEKVDTSLLIWDNLPEDMMTAIKVRNIAILFS